MSMYKIIQCDINYVYIFNQLFLLYQAIIK